MIIIQHRPGKATVMGIADGMSRMPSKYSQVAKAEDAERMAMTANVMRIALPTGLQPAKQFTSLFLKSPSFFPCSRISADGSAIIHEIFSRVAVSFSLLMGLTNHPLFGFFSYVPA